MRSGPWGGAVEGPASPRAWARLVVAARVHGLSGRLTVGRGARARRLSLVDGVPVDFSSDHADESVEHTLVACAPALRERVGWVRDHLGPEEDLPTGLRAAGALTPELDRRHRLHRLHLGVTAPLQVRSGTWCFEAHPRLRGAAIDPRLLPELEPLAALLDGVAQQLDINAELAGLADPAHGGWAPTPRLTDVGPALGADVPVAALAAALDGGADFESLFRRLELPVGDLVALMWTLEAGGLVVRPGAPAEDAVEAAMLAAASAPAPPLPLPDPSRRAAAEPPRQAERAPPPAVERPPAPRAKARATPRRRGRRLPSPAALERMVRGDHEHRMGLDAYGFLGVPPDADAATLADATSALERRWRLVQEADALPTSVRALAGELVAGVARAAALLAPARRSAYDAALERGDAAPVGARSPSAPPRPTSKLEQALALVEAGAFAKALPLLRQARMADPSSPEILSALGWVTWKTGGSAAAEDAADFLRLALAFDARSAEACERLARVLLSRRDGEGARPVLERLVRLRPQSGWAREALAALAPPPGDPGQSRRRQSGAGEA